MYLSEQLIGEGTAAQKFPQQACRRYLFGRYRLEIVEETQQPVSFSIFRHIVRHLFQYRFRKLFPDFVNAYPKIHP